MGKCKMRRDLFLAEMKIPIGNLYFHGDDELHYKWTVEDKFFVLLDGYWRIADSIDFDFID